MIRRTEIFSDATLYLGDCREILPTIRNIDAVVTDPPYGIDFDFTRQRNGSRSGLSWSTDRNAINVKRDWTKIRGDDSPFDAGPWIKYRQAILWGANNYQNMPPSRCWLIWDKRRETTPDNHGDAELAWTNLDSVIRVHRQVWRGIVREGEENVGLQQKLHPAQKPLALMRWCVGMTDGVVLDPFMGSGTTGVACVNLGRKFIGVEIEEKYFDIACRRIEEAYRQPRLFDDPKPAPTQSCLLETSSPDDRSGKGE